jgi:hypothetical protein
MLDRLPRYLLRGEGAVAAAAALALYFHDDHSWLLLLALVLAPDLAMIGFAVSQRAGTAAYNATHTSIWPVGLAAIGVLIDADAAVAVGLIWIIHIGIDRVLGYGLKYPSGFKDTHLQRV